MFRLDKDQGDSPKDDRKKDQSRRDREALPEVEVPAGVAVDDADTIVLVERSVNPYLVLFHEPTGYRAEQIRDLRNKLIAMNPDGSAKTLVVTSAMMGEGKTVAAINLGMAFAERERTPTVIVDADLRNPSIQQYLQVNPGPGLSDLLLGRVGLDAALSPTGVDNLTLLGAGGKVASPAELLTGGRINELLSRLKERFQYVVIDTPPVITASEASVLSSHADGTLLVVRLEHSARNMTQEAKRSLQDLGANLLGVFITEVRGRNLEIDPRFGFAPSGAPRGSL